MPSLADVIADISSSDRATASVDTIVKDIQEFVEEFKGNITSEKLRVFLFAKSFFQPKLTLKECEPILECLIPQNQVSARVRDTEFGISGTQLIGGSFELQMLTKHMLEMFKWHESDKERMKFAAPCIPIIQSSGTGKTKALHEFCRSQDDSLTDYDRFLISCLPKDTRRPSQTQDIYDLYLDLDNKTVWTTKLWEKLDNLKKKTSKMTKIVLAFDEAQELAKDGGPGLYSLRRYLRRKRDDKQIVAFLAGTSTTMANCYPTADQRKSSREGELDNHLYWQTGSALYPPLFEWYTMGCYRNMIRFDTAPNDGTKFTELDRAAPYGRPLFARLLFQEKSTNNQANIHFPVDAEYPLVDDDLAIIATRMLLNTTNPFDKESQSASSASVWAIRVQLGSTHLSLGDDFVARGYAHLTNFAVLGPGDTGTFPRATTSFTHMPDPVCARLAMCLMTEGWSLEVRDREIKGHPKKTWVEKLKEILAGELCRPSRGDTGELLSAVYLLFCGDELRRRRDPKKLRTFSISVDDWVTAITKPTELFSTDGDLKDADSLRGRPAVNFLQFCRNNLRFGLVDCCNEQFLGHIYKSCCAVYAHENCPLFDALAAIESYPTQDGTPKYTPLIMSIKTRLRFSKNMARKEVDNIVKALYDIGQAHGLILVVLLDRGMTEEEQEEEEDPSEPKRPKYARSAKTSVSPWIELANQSLECRTVDDCTEKLVARIITVPDKDPFGITNVARSLTSARDMNDVFSSQSFVGAIEADGLAGTRRSKKPQGVSALLRAKADQDDINALEQVWVQKQDEVPCSQPGHNSVDSMDTD